MTVSATVTYSHCYVARCPECEAMLAASCFVPTDSDIAADAAEDAREWLLQGDRVELMDVTRDGPLVFSGGHAAGCSRRGETMKQISIDELPDDQQAGVMDAVQKAIEQYPPVLVAGHLLHVCTLDGYWQVWLNTEDAEFTGLCVSTGCTRDEAVAEAVRVLEAVVAELQEPA